MILNITFQENNQLFSSDFGEVQMASDGGYEQGYEVGYGAGYENGLHIGYQEGLDERRYEIWTFTLDDGTIVEKEVPLL